MGGILTARRQEDLQAPDVRQAAWHAERFAVVGVPVHDNQAGQAFGRFVVLGPELARNEEEGQKGHATSAEAHVVLGGEFVFEDQGMGIDLVAEFARQGEEGEDLGLGGPGAGAKGEQTGGRSCSCCFQRVGEVVVGFRGGSPDMSGTGRHGKNCCWWWGRWGHLGIGWVMVVVAHVGMCGRCCVVGGWRDGGVGGGGCRVIVSAFPVSACRHGLNLDSACHPSVGG